MHSLRLTTTLALLSTSACSPSDSGTSPGSTTAETGHSHEPTEHSHDTGTETSRGSDETHGGSTAGTTGEPSLVDAYCECMLESCHDLYHSTWGEDHEQSVEMCKASLDGVPSVGAPAMSGDSIECRIHFCEVGHDDATACDSAMGAAPCM